MKKALQSQGDSSKSYVQVYDTAHIINMTRERRTAEASSRYKIVKSLSARPRTLQPIKRVRIRMLYEQQYRAYVAQGRNTCTSSSG